MHSLRETVPSSQWKVKTWRSGTGVPGIARRDAELQSSRPKSVLGKGEVMYVPSLMYTKVGQPCISWINPSCSWYFVFLFYQYLAYGFLRSMLHVTMTYHCPTLSLPGFGFKVRLVPTERLQSILCILILSYSLTEVELINTISELLFSLRNDFKILMCFSHVWEFTLFVC